MQREISNELSITTFLHCRRCIEEKPENISPRDYAQLEVGYTKIGLQIWCRRHNINIIHIDFENLKHPANLSSKDDERVLH